jgi:hypothetical protein
MLLQILGRLQKDEASPRHGSGRDVRHTVIIAANRRMRICDPAEMNQQGWNIGCLNQNRSSVR